MRYDFSTLSWKELLRKPAVALVLAILPIWLFTGAYSSTTIDGQVVQESHLNLLGLVLSGTGLGMALEVLWGDWRANQNWLPRSALAVVAALACIAQFAYSLDLYNVSN